MALATKQTELPANKAQLFGNSTLQPQQGIPENPAAPDSLLPRLMQALFSRSDETICHFHGTPISGLSLAGKVQRLASALQENGIGPESRVGVALSRSPDVLVVLLALWHCSAAYVPLDPGLPAERLLAQHNAARFTHLVVAPRYQEMLGIIPVRQLVLPAMDFNKTDFPSLTTLPLRQIPEAQLACILFTSGSTGQPKAVGVTHANLATVITGVLARLPLPSAFSLLGCANLSFDISLFELLAPILAEGSLILADDESYRNPELLLSMVRDAKINVVQATPSMWRLLLKLKADESMALTLALSTGEALDKHLAESILQHSQQLWNLYGPTECSLWSSVHAVVPADLQAEAPDFITIGQALPGYTLSLINEPDPLFDSGELVIEGPGVAPGYFHATAQQQASFIPPDQTHRYWQYRTGDRCARNALGGFHFLGRLDSQVKYNGYRIDLEEIAGFLRRHNSISDAYCVLKHRTNEGDQLIAFVLWRSGEPNKNYQQLRRHLARWLPEWMLPQRYIPLSVWPVGPQGKIDHSALLKLTEPLMPAVHKTTGLQSQPSVSALIASNALMPAVAGIFCEVLEVDSISPADNFFDLGGNSMLAASLVMSINEQLNAALRFREVLSSPPTVIRIVQMLQAQSTDSAV